MNLPALQPFGRSRLGNHRWTQRHTDQTWVSWLKQSLLPSPSVFICVHLWLKHSVSSTLDSPSVRRVTSTLRVERSAFVVSPTPHFP